MFRVAGNRSMSLIVCVINGISVAPVRLLTRRTVILTRPTTQSYITDTEGMRKESALPILTSIRSAPRTRASVMKHWLGIWRTQLTTGRMLSPQNTVLITSTSVHRTVPMATTATATTTGQVSQLSNVAANTRTDFPTIQRVAPLSVAEIRHTTETGYSAVDTVLQTPSWWASAETVELYKIF